MRLDITVTFAVEVPDDTGTTLTAALPDDDDLEAFTDALRAAGFDANAAMPDGWELVNATVDAVDEDPDDEDEDPDEDEGAGDDSWDDGDPDDD